MSDALLEDYGALEQRVLGGMRSDFDQAEFGALALEVHAFQRKWNSPYANFCATQPEPRNWRDIPAVPQSVFKRYRLSAFPAELITKTFRTSGTTGEGYGEHHFYTTHLYEEAVRLGWERLGLPILRQVILTPRAEEAPHSSLSHMMATLGTFGKQRYCIDSSGGIDFTAVEEESAGGEPVAVLGTALAFLHLCEDGPELRLPPGSFVMETGGYKGSGRDVSKAELYALFDRRLGLGVTQVLNEYGMTELSSQFYSRGLGQPHFAPPWLRALVIDPETGEEVPLGATGVLRIFDLANVGSVLALQTQDLAVRRKLGFELIGRSPAALPRGCSRAADEALTASR
jgi:hypothetical protein